MAANFWQSSHARMLFSRQEVLASNPKDREVGLSPKQIRGIKAFHIKYMSQLAQAMGPGKVRQRVVATAVVYFRRFYLKNSFVEYDPRLVAPSCLYLAAKAEESPIQARHLAQLLRKCRNEPAFWFEVKDVLAMEMILLEHLAFCLGVYHPYRDLQKFLDDAGLGDSMSDAWSIVNDAYLTEVFLMHAPYVVAVACVHISGVLQDRTAEMSQWLNTLTVDKDELTLVTADLLEVYEGKDTIMSNHECAHILNQIRAGWMHTRATSHRDSGQKVTGQHSEATSERQKVEGMENKLDG